MIKHEYHQKDHEGFDAGHRSVVRNNAISRDARLLFVIINSFSATKEGCYIGNGRLAFYMDCDVRSIRNWITELREAGVIKVRLINENRRRIEICSVVDNGDCDREDENKVEIEPGTPIPTPRNVDSYPPERPFHIGNGAKELNIGIPSIDVGASFSRKTEIRNSGKLPKDCLVALRDGGISPDGIELVASHLHLIKALAEHPKPSTMPRRCVAAARALPDAQAWQMAEREIPIALKNILNEKYLPGVEKWLEGRMWITNRKVRNIQETQNSRTVRLFLDIATPQQNKRFFEKQVVSLHVIMWYSRI